MVVSPDFRSEPTDTAAIRGQAVIASQLDSTTNAYLRRRLPGVQVRELPGAKLPSRVHQAQVLILRSAHRDSPVPAGWPWTLQWVQLLSSGIDAYPPWVLQAPQVTSGRGANAEAVAEYALAAIFAAAKQLPALWVHDDHWRFTTLAPVAGATLGIVGFGAIGQALARKAVALGMRVRGLGRPGYPIAEQPGVSPAANLEELLAQADHLVLAAPLTPHTRGLIDRHALAFAKPGLHLVNVARGALVDTPALLEALEHGRIGRATLDVTDPEPLPSGHPLYAHPQVHVSPHTAALSTDGLNRFVDIFVDNFGRYQRGEPLLNRVDPQRGY
ncbi:MAG: NAD(P)-dependent oxidoreductase [Pseudomonas sp.]